MIAFGVAVMILPFKKKTQSVFKSLYYIPAVASGVAMSVVWLWLYDSSPSGLFNQLLAFLHLPTQNWLSSSKTAMLSLILMSLLSGQGSSIIIYIAALMGIDNTYFEAAELDGASRFQKMWHVTLPGIRSTIVVLLIMNLGWVLNASFEVPYILGSGLLQDVSQTIDIFVLKYGMSIGNYSLATAAGIFKSVISLLLVFGTNAVANKLGENSLM